MGESRDSGVHALIDLLLAENCIKQHFISSSSQFRSLQNAKGTGETQCPLKFFLPVAPLISSPGAKLQSLPMVHTCGHHRRLIVFKSSYYCFVINFPKLSGINQQVSYTHEISGSGIQNGWLICPMMLNLKDSSWLEARITG